ncbi:uncharacterized protein LOC114448280 isoform X2 [Parambassis ranga]|uniref:Uncharacterized protein LOC114448280 isoform X2 n=1 Tax=Parambassis ranga TaxID=210632 RepID=A0A6P7JW62_9TELE|nr:uncharacterized protein LOC114448280 isoform X2 [Parambassis ranga]
MSGFTHVLLHFCILGYTLCGSNAWHVHMPSNIKGLLDSCLVIPCSFDYYRYPPRRPDRVVWYQYVSHGYPLVYDNWHPKDVIGIFRGKTQRVDDTTGKTCSLRIYPVTWSHYRQKIYPWVDPENVGKSTYKFYDTTVVIDVVDRANEPKIVIYGEMKVGNSVRVQCTVDHTCRSNPPTLRLNIPLRDHRLTHSHQSDGTTTTTLSTTLTIQKSQQTVECLVRHYGGRTAKTYQTLNARCSVFPLSISSTSIDVLEGFPSKVTCTASYTCPEDTPSLSWNYASMPANTENIPAGAQRRTVSTLTFTSSANDNGRSLTCYARFPQGQTQEESLTIRVKKTMLSRGWSFTTPGAITGLKGSCIVIPCNFIYTVSQPANLQVVWYLYQSNGYPAVFNQRDRNVISEFNGLTSLIGNVAEQNCSLKIQGLKMSHNQDRLYPWIDENPITSYYTMGHSFYDKTTQLIVSDHAQEPQLSLISIPRVGEQSTVSCSVRHTCISAPPTLTIEGIHGKDCITDTVVSDGIWERKVERSWTVEEENKSVRCTVSYPSGQRASSDLTLNVECPFEEIKMTEPPGDIMEGVAKSVVCSVMYRCNKNRPTIVWNMEDVQSKINTKLLPNNNFKTESNLTYIGSEGDNGKPLTCTATFVNGKTSDSATLHIKRNLLSRGWSCTTPKTITGLKGSCIVIPCNFIYTVSQPANLQVVWYLYQSNGYPAVFNQRDRNVISEFNGLTSLIGNVAEQNCSLKIQGLKMSHNQDRLYPWIDENPITSYYTMGHSFYDEATKIIVLDHAQEPQLTLTGNTRVGEQSTVSCSVRHTCISASPTLTIEGIPGRDRITDTLVSDGIWERKVERSWTVEEENKSVRCTVSYPSGQRASSDLTLNVECPFREIKMTEPPGEVMQGTAKSIVCSVIHKCKKNRPTIVWNMEDMQSSPKTRMISNSTYKTESNLTYTGSLTDDGKSLTCTAKFTNGETSDSATLHIKRDMFARGWSFTTPGSINGLKGSCMVIPCKFTYSASQPADLQVIWYLYQSVQSEEYPAVFNQRDRNVISEFNGLTSFIGNVAEQNCSLKIQRLEMSHNEDRLYPWIDVNPITSYHSMGSHLFFDKTTQLIVSDHAQEPQLSLTEKARVGEKSTVSCSVRHTCISAPPTLTIEGIPGKDRITDTLVSDGIWERKVERSWTVEEENKSVRCTVSYPSGQRASSDLTLNVECPFEEIKMTEPPGEVMQGTEKSVVCSVIHKCKKDTPTIVWNMEDMQSSRPNPRMISTNKYQTESKLTYVGSADDDGKPLTCTAKFTNGETSDSATLRIKTFYVLPADVPVRVSALTRSCVVIPCSYHYPEDGPMTRGIWSKKTGGIVFHNGQSNVIDHFKGRTRISENMNEGNCSLEIDDIMPFDNGPFCFHAEKGRDNYRFNNSCVFIVMKASPEKPVMTPVPAEVDAGSTITASCSVTHTCPSHPPAFSWSVPNLTSEVSHTLMSGDTWETTSTISFMAAGGDGVKSLTCTATFWRGKQQASTAQLNVKGSLKYNIRSSLHVSIPVTLLILMIIGLAAVFGVFIWRKRKHADDSVTPPPRPEKRRSLLDRLTRRYPENRDPPPRPEKRRSIWSRVSRRAEEMRFGWSDTPRQSFWSRFSRRQDNTSNLSVAYFNNTSSGDSDIRISNPPFLPPKSNRR